MTVHKKQVHPQGCFKDNGANKLRYHIQVGAGHKARSVYDPQFKNLKLQRVSEEGLYKYLHGNFNTYEQARQNLTKIRKKLSQAYIVAYNDGKRIKIGDARRLENHKKKVITLNYTQHEKRN